MVSEAAPLWVASLARVLTVGWSRRRRAVCRWNPTFVACISACDMIHGVGLPMSMCSSPTGREGSAADRASPATLRRRRVGSSSSSSKTRIPSFYSLRVRVRGQTSALVPLIEFYVYGSSPLESLATRSGRS
jgi:hypothetical protein